MSRRRANFDKRWDERRDVEVKAKLRTRVHGRYEVEVLDISLRGIRVATYAKHEIGQRVSVQLPSLQPLRARIVWQSNHQIGCHFDDPIHPAVLELLAQRHRALIED